MRIATRALLAGALLLSARAGFAAPSDAPVPDARRSCIAREALMIAAPAGAPVLGTPADAPELAPALAPALTPDASPLLAPAPPAFAADEPVAALFHRRPKGEAAPKRVPQPPVLGVERARTLLRSLTFPGWGQAASGHRTSGAVFALAETGIWTSFAAFRIQEQMRTLTYVRTARLFAGIDLSHRDNEFRRIVGAYVSSDEYNRLVVFRDAANLFYGTPGYPQNYLAYIAAHELRGADTWNWGSLDALAEYQGQRKNAQRAALRANTALALAVIDRLVSAVHAARLRPGASSAPHSWRLEVAPTEGGDATAFHAGIRAHF